MLNAIDSISSGVTRGTSARGVGRPSTRRYGWLPTFRCKSEALLSTARRRRSSMLSAMKCDSAKMRYLATLTPEMDRGKEGESGSCAVVNCAGGQERTGGNELRK